MELVDCLVVGAGVVGLATARALARAGREVIIVESQDCIGSGISSRNSEVIHAGYYPSNLNEARWCVSGKAMLYEFCRSYHVPHRRCGKLLVAMSEAEVDKLSAIKVQAGANGVMDLVWLSGAEARALEPALAVHRALFSPSTGIIDSHAMHALRGHAELHGAMVAVETPVLSGRVDGGGLILETGGASPTEIAAKVVINAAGLGSHALAAPSSECPPTRSRPSISPRGIISP
jgi:L-2-hydroxyglutarate oxidase LhgO